jgi:cytochrome P450
MRSAPALAQHDHTPGRQPFYRPPAPEPVSPLRALWRSVANSKRDLLNLLPDEAYRVRIAPLGTSRRGILLINEPAIVQRIMAAESGDFPKNDLFVGALAPLVGNGVFISHGEDWTRQRRMIEPGFSHMHLARAYPAMLAAVQASLQRFDVHARDGRPFSLNAAMTHVTADVMCRTIFSEPLNGGRADRVFAAFKRFQDSIANVDILQLLLGKPFAQVLQPPAAVRAGADIRALIAQMIEVRRKHGQRKPDDIASDLMATRDKATGARFTTEELVDQIGVFFLAGHETTASTVTWALYLISQNRDVLQDLRREIDALGDRGLPTFEQARGLQRIGALIKETLRLYPPGPFLPRVAKRHVEIGGYGLKRGGMAMVSPWLLHRHVDFWEHPDQFDPSRFLPDREKQIPRGAYIPFGLGPRVCVGAAFATIEASLILAAIIQRYDVLVQSPLSVRPVAKLTIQSERDIQVRFTPRA